MTQQFTVTGVGRGSATVTFTAGGKSATVPADARSVRLRVSSNRGTAVVADFDMRAQLEAGSAATAWERPDNVGWGGVAPSPNLWREVPSGTFSGCAFAVGEHGEVTVSGAAIYEYANASTAQVELPAGTYRLACAGCSNYTYAQVTCVHAGGNKSYYDTRSGTSAVTVSEGDAVAFMVQRAQAGGESATMTLWPSLTEGAEAQPYLPYVLGRGASEHADELPDAG